MLKCNFKEKEMEGEETRNNRGAMTVCQRIHFNILHKILEREFFQREVLDPDSFLDACHGKGN